MTAQVTITEDTALQLGVSVQSIVDVYSKLGYRIVGAYSHPAVGMVYTMQK